LPQLSLLATLLGRSRSLSGRCGSGRGSGSLTVGNSLASESLILADSVLGATSLSLLLKISLTDDLSLGLVNGLDEDVLVLELVTLGSKVELVVHLAVDLLVVSIATEQTTEDAKTAHPQDASGHTSVPSTLSLSGALMATLALGLGVHLAAGARVSGDDLPHDKPVLAKLPNVLAYIPHIIIIKTLES